MSEQISRQFGERYLQEVQFFSQAETSPYEQGLMLAARMEAGDAIEPHDLIRQYLLADAYMRTPGREASDENARFELGHLTIDALLSQGHFLPLYHLTSSRLPAVRISSYYVQRMLLRSGYPGPHDELLQLYDATFLLDPTIDRHEAIIRGYLLREYLAAVATCGIDLRDINSDLGLLFAGVSAIGSDQLDRDLGLSQVAHGYAANSSCLDAAWYYQSQIAHPPLRYRTAFAIGAASNTTETLQHVANTVGETEIRTLTCRGDCRYFRCNPVSNCAELGLEAARVHAELGNVEAARRFATISNEASVFLDTKRLAATAALYQASGLAADRTGILSLINNSQTPLAEAQSIVRSTSQTDLRTGRTLPVSEADEGVPLIAWELAAAFSRPNREEVQVDANPIEQEYFRKYREHRLSRLLGTLAVHLGEQQLPAGADYVLRQINRSVDRIRAMTELARIYGVLDTPATPRPN